MINVLEKATTITEKKIINKAFWMDSIVEPFQDDFSTMGMFHLWNL